MWCVYRGFSVQGTPGPIGLPGEIGPPGPKVENKMLQTHSYLMRFILNVFLSSCDLGCLGLTWSSRTTRTSWQTRRCRYSILGNLFEATNANIFTISSSFYQSLTASAMSRIFLIYFFGLNAVKTTLTWLPGLAVANEVLAWDAVRRLSGSGAGSFMESRFLPGGEDIC